MNQQVTCPVTWRGSLRAPPAPRGLYGSAGHTGGGGEGRADGRTDGRTEPRREWGHGVRTAPPLSAASARRALSPPRPSGALARGLGFLLPAGRGDGGSPLGRPGRGSFRGPFAPAGDTARPRASGAGSGASRPIAASPGSERAGPAGVAGGQGGLAAASPPRTPFLGGLPEAGGRPRCREGRRAGSVPPPFPRWGGGGARRVAGGSCVCGGGGVFLLCFSPPFLPPGSSPFFLPSLLPLPAPSVTGLRNCGCLKLNVIFTVPAGVCNVSDK
ncbi:uncharacterized protein LOC116443115 [Corvus moneduloides]|uniref:uncharacterized protein LOC116443115 n=1 Tax=Corvus moneduloides TaxID=1196302 RepID=UPI0013639C54|nr:uncharacterized protein LOC116443115 [Corvus moneduloides]